MRKQRGFTLIELLVVIGIIAILVAIVMVAIDPVQRLNDARNRTAASNVRSTGTLISSCIVTALEGGSSNAFLDCDNNPAGELASYGNVPPDVTINSNDTANDTCAVQQGSIGIGANYYVYKSSTGAIEEVSGTVPGVVSGWCPNIP